MITFKETELEKWAEEKKPYLHSGDCSLGNLLFFLAGTIGIAVKNGYSYGFPDCVNLDIFSSRLPELEKREYTPVQIEWGDDGFNTPDNSSIFGWMQSDRSFSHCRDLIRGYFTLKDMGDSYSDTIVMHYRNYRGNPWFVQLGADYYRRALEQLPNKRVVVVTDDIEMARSVLGDGFEYVSNSPIVDFWLLTKADYVVVANSTFSWWGAYLSNAVKVVSPREYFTDAFPLSSDGFHCKTWLKT